MLLNNQWITEEIKVGIKKYQDQWGKSTMIQNLWNAGKAVLRGKFIAIQSCFIKRKKISNKQPNIVPNITREK